METILVRLSSLRAKSLLCVGHEPTLSRLIAVLTSRDGSAQVEMAESGVAIVDCSVSLVMLCSKPAGGRLHLFPAGGDVPSRRLRAKRAADVGASEPQIIISAP